jgi:hypothetical protein
MIKEVVTEYLWFINTGFTVRNPKEKESKSKLRASAVGQREVVDFVALTRQPFSLEARTTGLAPVAASSWLKDDAVLCAADRHEGGSQGTGAGGGRGQLEVVHAGSTDSR